MTQSRPTVIVSGMIAADPGQGGATWAVLQYVLGLRRLGCNVHLIEPVPPASLRPQGSSLADSTNAAYFRAVASDFAVTERATLLRSGTQQTVGQPYDALLGFCRRADALVNISGMLTDEALVSAIPVRIYLDLDPGFNQLWHSQGIDMRLAGHTHF